MKAGIGVRCAAPEKLRIAAILIAYAVSSTACTRSDDAALPGTLERDRIELVAEATEAIAGINVREGEAVAQGAVVLIQDGDIAAAQLAASAAQTAQAQARLDELRNGTRDTTLQAARARRDGARVQRDDDERERRRLLTLVAQNLVSRAAYDRQAAVAQASAAVLQEAEAALRELQAGTRREQLVAAQRALEQAQAQQREANTNSNRLEIRAPQAATVDALPYRVGEKPARGATVAVLLSAGAPYVRIHVPEPLRARVHAGTTATIRADGVAQAFSGRVRYISSEAEFTPYFSLTESDRSRLSYMAEISVESAAASKLPAGLPATVSLQLATVP